MSEKVVGSKIQKHSHVIQTVAKDKSFCSVQKGTDDSHADLLTRVKNGSFNDRTSGENNLADQNI